MLVPGSYSALKWEKGCNNTNTFVNVIVSTVNTVATVLTAEVVVNFEKSWYLKKNSLLVSVVTNLVRLVIKFLKISQTVVINKVRSLIVAGC